MTESRTTTTHYLLDSTHSRATFTTRHLFGLGTVTGTMAVVGGEVDLATDGTGGVSADLDAASFSTGSDRRDRDVRGPKYLAVDSHPTIRFTGRLDEQRVSGTLTVRGHEAPARLDVVDLAETGDGLLVTAAGRVDRFALGITAGKGLAARHLDVTLAVVLRRT